MTMAYGEAEEPTVTLTAHQSVPVHVASSDLKPGKQIGTEFGQFRTIIVNNTVGNSSATPGAQRLLNRSLRRKRAHIIINTGPNSAFGPGFTGLAVEAEGSATAPAANTIIASISAAQLLASAPIGTTWTVAWTVSLAGTPGAADVDNVNVQMPIATVRAIAVMPGVVGNWPQNPFQVTPAPGNNISAVAIGAAAAGSVYSVQMVATPSLPSFPNDGVIVGTRQEILSGVPAIPGQLGGYLQIGDNIRYESQAELWVCWPATNGGQAVYVTTCDEVWASDVTSQEEERHHGGLA